MDPRLYEAMVAGTRSQIDDLKQEIREFEELENASLLHMKFSEDFARVLIHGRVARGLTQNELAKKLNLKPQQIQKYEATQYRAQVSREFSIYLPPSIWISRQISR